MKMHPNFSPLDGKTMKEFRFLHWPGSACWLALIAQLAFLLAVPPAHGASRSWQGTHGSYWSTPANWSPTGRPQNGDSLRFTNRVSSYITNDIDGLSVYFVDFFKAFRVYGTNLTLASGAIMYWVNEPGMEINFHMLIVSNASLRGNGGPL